METVYFYWDFVAWMFGRFLLWLFIVAMIGLFLCWLIEQVLEPMFNGIKNVWWRFFKVCPRCDR